MQLLASSAELGNLLMDRRALSVRFGDRVADAIDLCLDRLDTAADVSEAIDETFWWIGPEQVVVAIATGVDLRLEAVDPQTFKVTEIQDRRARWTA